MTINSIILSKKLKDDAFSFKMFFLACLAGASTLLSWGMSGSIFGFARDVNEVATTFTLFSAIASMVVFAPISGILFGSDVFTENGRVLVFGCISRRNYLLSRWFAVSLLVMLGALLSIAIPLLISYTRLHGVDINANFLLAVICSISFSLVFVSLSTLFSVVANSTMASLVLSAMYTTVEFGLGFAGYASHNKILYYFSPHALLIKGVLPEHERITIQLTSIAVLLIYSAVFMWLAIYYSRRDI